MQRVIIPFKLSKNIRETAESEFTFTVQQPQSSFRRISIQALKFMKIYEQSKYTGFVRPVEPLWEKWNTYLNEQRALVSDGNYSRPDLNFGHGRSPELRALDELPALIEIEIVRSTLRVDRTNLGVESQQDYQTVETSRLNLVENDRKIQSTLVYNTNLISNGLYPGFVGTLSCNMDNIGFVNVADQGYGNTFTIKVKMFDFKNKGMSYVPRIEMMLLFK